MFPTVHGILGQRGTGPPVTNNRIRQAVIRPHFGSAVDAYILSTAPNTNTALDDQFLVCGNASSSAVCRVLIKMPLFSVPENAEILSARLVLYCENALNTTSYDLTIHRSLVEWFAGPGFGSTYSTWNHRDALNTVAWPGGAGGASGTEWAATPTDTVAVQYHKRYYTFDVTADVADFADGTHSNYGWWILHPSEATSSASKRFGSSRGDNRGFAPYLLIEYQEPGAAGDWFDPSFGYRKKLTIDSSYVSAALEDFPLLVDVTGDAHIGANGRADLRDIVFTADDGTSQLAHERAGPYYDIANNTGYWTFFGGERAVRYVGTSNKTYFAFANRNFEVQVMAYNHGTGAYEGPTTLRGSLALDDHTVITLAVRDDGHIMAFYQNTSPSEVWLRVSTNPEDITSFASEQALHAQIGSFGSVIKYVYPAAIQLTGETDDPVYLFYTAGNAADTRRLCFSKSTNGGANWAAEKLLFGDNTHWVYWHAAANGNARIDFVVSDGVGYEDTSLYHFYYHDGNYYKSDGTLIGDDTALPLGVDDVTLVYDGTTESAWNLDIAVEGGGNPVIGYVRYVAPGLNNHSYRYARWNGSSWANSEIALAGGRIQRNQSAYPGGLKIDKANAGRVFLSRQHNGVFNIFEYTTSDNGATWSQQDQLTNDQAYNHVRPYPVLNGHADLPVVWMAGNYIRDTSPSTAIACKKLDMADGSVGKFWVRVPEIASGVDTEIYVYYGSDNKQHYDTPDQVWLAYDIVVHGWKISWGVVAMTPPQWRYSANTLHVPEVDATIYKALDYPATSRVTPLFDINQRSWPTITTSMLLKRKAGPATICMLYTGGGGSAHAGKILRVTSSTNVLRAHVYTTSALNGGDVSGVSIAVDTLYRLAARYSSVNGIEAFVNKTAATPLAVGSGVLANINSLESSVGWTGAPNQYMTGEIEELRLTEKLLSNAWLNFVYDNIFSNGDTITTGTQETP
jgi:hypothetical protein